MSLMIISLLMLVLFQLCSKLMKEVLLGACMLTLWMMCSHSNFGSEEFFTDECSYKMIIMCMIIYINITMMAKSSGKTITILMVFTAMMVFFSSSSMITMFISFESSLIPIMLLILMYGTQPERISAVQYMMLYTVLTSVPLLISIICYMNQNYLFFITHQWSVEELITTYSIMGMMAAFLVKIPMFGVHVWLPKAHVEAPVEGSMILAGIMLKMGVFGIIRVTSLFMYQSPTLLIWLMSLFLLGSILASWISLSVDDMKMNVAFSSIGHMNFMMVGFMIYKAMSLKSCILIMISHGLCSALLFFLVTIFYNKTHSRSFIISKGAMTQFPVMVMITFIGWAINFACPPSISFIGEVLCLSTIMSYSMLIAPMALFYIVMNSLFCIMSYGVMCYSNSKIQYKDCYNSLMSMMISYSFIIPLIVAFFSMEMVV